MKYSTSLAYLLFLFFPSILFSQNVTVAGAHASSNGSYARLSAAFGAINAQVQTNNNIVVTITGNVVETDYVSAAGATSAGTTITVTSTSGLAVGMIVRVTAGAGTFATATYVTSITNSTTFVVSAAPTVALSGGTSVITAQGALLRGGVWNSVVIYPTSSGLSITGSIVGAPLIYLNGADKVILDGRVNRTGIADLVISNSSTSIVSLTSTIMFDNDAVLDSVEYCTIKGSQTGTTTAGVIMFNSGSTNTGSDSITVMRNNITSDAAGRPYCLVYHMGLNSVGKECSFNNIINNNFYDFSNPAIGNKVVNINIGSVDVLVSGNSFYETSSVTGTSTSGYDIIYLSLNTNDKVSITGNYIGGSGPLCTGTWTKTGNNQAFNAININSTSTAYSNLISNNTIKNFAWTNTGSATFTGIQVVTGPAILSNNTIGSTTGTGSIILSTGATGAFLYGMNISSTQNVSILKNNIGAITSTNAGTLAANIFCISRTSSGNSTISNNLIGSLTTANSINAASGSTANNQSVVGISINSSGRQLISDNTIANMTNQSSHITTGNAIVSGISYSGPTVGYNLVTRNFIRNLSTPSSTVSAMYGIFITAGATTYSNNIISIGVNTPVNLFGIFETGGASNNNNLYFNTVYLYGTPTSGVQNSYCLYSTNSASTKVFQNNNFYNARSNSGASGKNYAASFQYANYASLTVNYNNYYAPGTGGVLGFSNAADKTILPLITSQDANSGSVDPSLSSAGGSNATDYYATASITGLNISTVIGDYQSITRASTPKKGALESLTPVNTVSVYNSGTLLASYPNLRIAFDSINIGKHTGALTVIITASHVLDNTAVLYQSGINLAGTSNYTSVNIYPASSGIVVSGSIGSTLIELNGADNITIDGRVGATGSAKDLIITNARGTILFINGATNNTIKYCTIKGGDANPTSGIINFSNTSGTSGNSLNLVDNNDLTSDFYGRPVNGVYSYGTSGYLNSTNTISNNSIYDIYNPNTTNVFAINIGYYSTDWTLNANSIYETGTVTQLISQNYTPIQVIPYATGKGFSITNNYIGGNSAQASGTYTITATGIGLTFKGINLSVYGIGNTYINQNTIRNLNITSSSTAFFGIYLDIFTGSGSVIMADGNVIGSGTGTGSITLNTTATSNTSYGIYTQSGNGGSTFTLQNSIIGSITTIGTATTVSHSFTGIMKTNGGATTIQNNLIGSTTTANSIYTSSVATTSTAGQSLFGFNTDAANKNTYSLNNNTIANLTNNYNGTNAGLTIGMGTNTNNQITFTNNSIYNLTTASAYTGDSSVASLIGIKQIHPFTGGGTITISGNTIYNLSNTSTTGNIVVIGIFQGRSATTSNINRNFIYGLSVASSSSSAAIKGIVVGYSITATTATINNNIINLGNASASPIIYGIYDMTIMSTLNLNLYFNSVYLSGSPTAGTGNSAAFWNTNNANTRNIRNNIFYNARSNSGGTGKHYAIGLSGIGGSITINYNNYYTPGTGGIIGFLAADQTTLANWQTATAQDANSANANPNFTLAGSNIASDYKISSIPSSNGVSIVSYANDHGLQSRGAIVTMGAWEYYHNRWIGTTSTAFNIATNWTGGYVIASGDKLVFDAAAVRNCNLDATRIVGGIYNSTAYDVVTNNQNLAILDSITFTGTGRIDASSASGTVTFAGTVPQYIPANSIRNDLVTKLTINNPAGVTLGNALTVSTLLTLTGGKFNVSGNTLTLNGTNTLGTTANLNTTSSSSLVFGGSSSGVIIPSGVSNLNNLTINNSNGITLGSSPVVNGTLTLTNGLINNSTYYLTLTATSNVTGATDSSYVNGVIYKTGNSAFTFPIGGNNGAGNRYRPCTISAPAVITDQFSAEYKWQNPNSAGYDTSAAARPLLITKVSGREYWNVNRVAGSSNVDLTLTFNDSSYVNNLSNLRVLHWNGSSWDNLGGTASGTVSNGSIIASTVSTFSPFALGSIGVSPNPLPVKLIQFSATIKTDDVLLRWTTASEINNDHFDIERSTDGKHFEKIGEVQGSGNTTQKINYEYLDKDVNHSINKLFYYRLKQVDYNQTFDYSNTATVLFNATREEGIESIYPNPIQDEVNILTNQKVGGNVKIKIMDMSGRIILQQEVKLSGGSNIIRIETNNLPKGSYLVSYECNEKVETIKVVK